MSSNFQRLPGSTRYVTQLRQYHGNDPTTHVAPIPTELEDNITLDSPSQPTILQNDSPEKKKHSAQRKHNKTDNSSSVSHLTPLTSSLSRPSDDSQDILLVPQPQAPSEPQDTMLNSQDKMGPLDSSTTARESASISPTPLSQGPFSNLQTGPFITPTIPLYASDDNPQDATLDYPALSRMD